MLSNGSNYAITNIICSIVLVEIDVIGRKKDAETIVSMC